MRTPEQYAGWHPLVTVHSGGTKIGIYMADYGRTLRLVYYVQEREEVCVTEIPALMAYPLGKALISLGDEGGVV